MSANNFRHNSIFLSHILLTIVLCLITCLSVSAQVKKNDAQTTIPVVSQEVYQSIARFYEYDKSISIDDRILSNEKYEGAYKQKIVFQGINNSRVPALLIVPKDGQLTHP